MTTTRKTAGPPLPRLTTPWSLRRAEAHGDDLELIHGWMQTPHVAAFWKQNWSRSRWAEELQRQRTGIHSLPCLVTHNGSTIAYLEVYRVVHDRLAGCYAHQPTDLGVHVAIGDLRRTGSGLGSCLLRAVADSLLSADPDCERVVAEPDVHNVPSIKAFQKAGFDYVNQITLPDKTAALLIHPRHSLAHDTDAQADTS